MGVDRDISQIMKDRQQIVKDIKSFDSLMNEFKKAVTDIDNLPVDVEWKKYNESFAVLRDIHTDLSDHIAMVCDSAKSMQKSADNIKEYFTVIRKGQ